MKRKLTVALLVAAILLPFALTASAARVRVKRGPRGRVTKVTVRPGFPIHRTFPTVVVRPAPVVRVTSRVYLAPVVFGAVVVASLPDPQTQVWKGETELGREDGWTDFTVNVDHRGDRMFFEIDHGAAQISFAEVVFDNGDAQVVDFDDKVHGTGYYSLLDFKDGRKVDHVRVIARSSSDESIITLHLTA